MDWFQGSSEVGGSSHHRHSSSHHKHDSKHDSKHDTRSIFGGLGSPRHHSSRSSFFGFGRSSSYYKRSPRDGYLRRIFHRLRKLLRDLLHFMKKNPLKVFMLVIMPLITGGALTTLLARFGVRLPAGLDRMFGGRGGRGMEFERTSVEGPLAAIGGLSSLAGGLGGVANVAKMFL